MKKIKEIYTKEEQPIYVLDKLMCYLIFTDDHESYRHAENFFRLDFLNSYKEVVAEFVECGYLNRNIKNNIYNFLLYLREVKDENTKKRIEIINDIISIVNCQVDNNCEFFYKAQLIKRRNYDPKKQYRITADIIKEIHDSICCDYIVVVSHLSLYTPSLQFERHHLQNLTDNITYLESLNFILKECPSLFLDATFKDRMNMCLDNSENKAIKTLGKKISRVSKKITKQIEG